MADSSAGPTTEKVNAGIRKGTAAAAGDGEAMPAPVQIKGDTRTPDGIAPVLQAVGLRHRYNIRSDRFDVSDSGAPWRERDDLFFDDLRVRRIPAACLIHDANLDRLKPLVMADGALRTALSAHSYRHQVDPFVEWLEALPEWDGRPRNWLAGCFPSLADNALARWASESIPLAAVWRAYKPGYPVQEIPVLQGPQGTGKSTALRSLLPADRRQDWFTDHVSLAAPLKEFVEGLTGRVIVELSELTGATRLETEWIKSRITTTDDNSVRLAYRRDPKSRPRRCVLVGTTNAADCLPNDPTGNRRFILLPTTEGAADHVKTVTAYMDAHRDQIWAEALAAYRAGKSSMLPHSLKVQQAAVNDDFRRGNDAIEDLVETYLTANGGRATVADVQAAARKAQLRDFRDGEVQHALKLAGAMPDREYFQGHRRRVWVRPAA